MFLLFSLLDYVDVHVEQYPIDGNTFAVKQSHLLTAIEFSRILPSAELAHAGPLKRPHYLANVIVLLVTRGREPADAALLQNALTASGRVHMREGFGD